MAYFTFVFLLCCDFGFLVSTAICLRDGWRYYRMISTDEDFNSKQKITFTGLGYIKKVSSLTKDLKIGLFFMAILLIALSVSSVFMTINLTISVGRLSLLAAQIVILKIATLLVESFCNYIKTERSKCSYLLDELRKKIKNGELPPSEFWKES